VKENVRRNGYKQAVAVLSLGGPKAQSLNDAINDLVKVSELALKQQRSGG
jgi:hypothetical protein